MKDETGAEASDLSIISKDGKIMVLAPDTSKVYEHELTGKFAFAVFVGNSRKDLGIHELKGGMVTAIIKKENEDFIMELK
jgi:hypothetical protein